VAADELVWLAFAFAVVGPLVLTNVLWFTRDRRGRPERASLFANLQFFLAAVFAVLMLSESITPHAAPRRVADRPRASCSRRASAAGRGPASPLSELARRLARRRPATVLDRPRPRDLLGADGDAAARGARPDDRRDRAAAIVSDLGGITQYSWVFTAYMLTSTGRRCPLYGRLGDVHGRRPLMLIAVTLFLVGSALCGLGTGTDRARSSSAAFRVLGAGGLFPLSLAVIGRVVPPRDRGRWQGLIGAVFAASSIIGPAVGGFIVDNTSWRWIFLVNLPVGAGRARRHRDAPMPSRLRCATEHEPSTGSGRGCSRPGTPRCCMGLVWGGRDLRWTSEHVVGALLPRRLVLRSFGLGRAPLDEPILPVRGLPSPHKIVAASVRAWLSWDGDVRDDLVLCRSSCRA
jgi:hypothetical protein